MYTQVASKLSFDGAGDTFFAFSEAVAMNGGNAIAVELTVFSGSGVKVQYQVSNDLENWDDGTDIIVGGGSGVGVGYDFGDTDAVIASEYVRLKYSAGGSAVLAAGVNVASL